MYVCNSARVRHREVVPFFECCKLICTKFTLLVVILKDDNPVRREVDECDGVLLVMLLLVIVSEGYDAKLILKGCFSYPKHQLIKIIIKFSGRF